MKYIRTKYGIWKYNENNEKDFLNYCSSATANTIEELCDTFVFIVGEGKLVIDSFTKSKEYYNSGKKENMVFSLYGAIWTDKGLIYVAKMNDKGELELI